MKIVTDYNENEELKRIKEKRKKIIIASAIIVLIIALLGAALYKRALNRRAEDTIATEDVEINPDLVFLDLDEEKELEAMSEDVILRTVISSIRESQDTPIKDKREIMKSLGYIKRAVDKGYNLDNIQEFYNEKDHEYYIKYMDILNFVHAVNYLYDGADSNSEDAAYFFTGISKDLYKGSKEDPDMNFDLGAIDSINPYNASDFLYYSRYMVQEYVWNPGSMPISANDMYYQMMNITVSDFVNKTERDTDINNLPITSGIIQVVTHNVEIKDLENYKVTMPIFTDAYEYSPGKKSKFIIPMYSEKDGKFLLGIFDEEERIVNLEVVKERR